MCPAPMIQLEIGISDIGMTSRQLSVSPQGFTMNLNVLSIFKPF